MKREMFRKLMAASLATVMTVGLAGCGGGDAATDSSASDSASTSVDASTPDGGASTPDGEGEVAKFTPLKDKNGNVYDLGGMNIIIADWWTDNDADPAANLTTEYDEAAYAYQQEVQKAYNFTIQQKNVTGWNDIQGLTDYITSNGKVEDVKGYNMDNVVFLFPFTGALPGAIENNLFYNLKTLDCLDFSEPKYANNMHTYFATDDAYYMFSPVSHEPRGGLFFNKRIVKEAGIEPNDLYKWQESGEWTWDKFIEVCEKITADTDNDGQIDRWALCTDDSNTKNGCVYSNMGTYIDFVDGKYVFTADSEKTIKGMEFALDLLKKYNYHPEGAEWDYWKEAYAAGAGAFNFGECYMAANEFKNMDDDFGFVCYPKGPDATDYNWGVNDNVYIIPSCYSPEQAWNIAFAINAYTDPVPGYENVNSRDSGYYNTFRDTESVELTIHRMYSTGVIPMHNLVNGIDFGNDYLWNEKMSESPAAAAEGCKAKWTEAINKANGN